MRELLLSKLSTVARVVARPYFGIWYNYNPKAAGARHVRYLRTLLALLNRYGAREQAFFPAYMELVGAYSWASHPYYKEPDVYHPLRRRADRAAQRAIRTAPSPSDEGRAWEIRADLKTQTPLEPVYRERSALRTAVGDPTDSSLPDRYKRIAILYGYYGSADKQEHFEQLALKFWREMN